MKSSKVLIILILSTFEIVNSSFGETLEEKVDYIVRIRANAIDIILDHQYKDYMQDLRQNPRESIGILLSILRNVGTEEEVRSAIGLISILGRNPDITQDARSLIKKFLKGEISKKYKDRHSVTAALSFLVEIGKPQDFDDILGLLDDNNPETRFIILSALKKIGRPEDAEKLLIKMRTLKSKKGKYPDDDEFFEGLDQAVVHLRAKG